MHSGDMVETEIGLCEVFMVESDASEVQRLVAPWFIAMYRLSYSKSLKLDGIKQVVMATATKLGLIEPTLFVSPRSVAYIPCPHCHTVDSVTILQADSPNTQALRNENLNMICQELQGMIPVSAVTMRKQSRSCF